MSTPYTFTKPAKNDARDEMLLALEAGPCSKRQLINIGERHELFAGEVTGMVYALATNGDIKPHARRGWWTLPFTPESLGEVELIGPETTRIGDVISHKGEKYVLNTQE